MSIWMDRPHHATATEQILRYLLITVLALIVLYVVFGDSLDVAAWLDDFAADVGLFQ